MSLGRGTKLTWIDQRDPEQRKKIWSHIQRQHHRLKRLQHIQDQQIINLDPTVTESLGEDPGVSGEAEGSAEDFSRNLTVTLLKMRNLS